MGNLEFGYLDCVLVIEQAELQLLATPEFERRSELKSEGTYMTLGA